MHYGPVMIDLSGLELTAQELELLAQPAIGGVILFEKNYRDKQQLTALVAAIRVASPQPLLITVDHEGEPLWRFSQGFTQIPAASFFGQLYRHDSDKALQAASQSGFVMAAELLACGIDLSFAPVLDVDRALNACLKDRCFHADPAIVAALGGAFIKGMHWAGMAVCGKHFPGHGGVSLDPHVSRAHDPRSYEELMREDMWPFQALHPELDALMTAHVHFSQVDEQIPCYSEHWLKHVLRQQIGFKGAIISDCLMMPAAIDDQSMLERCNLALDRGCDMVLLTQAQDALSLCLDEIIWDKHCVTRAQRLHALSGQSDKKAKQPRETAEIWEIL